MCRKAEVSSVCTHALRPETNVPTIECFSTPNATKVRTSGTRYCAKLHSDAKYLGNKALKNDKAEVGLAGLSSVLALASSSAAAAVPTAAEAGSAAAPLAEAARTGGSSPSLVFNAKMCTVPLSLDTASH